MGKKYLIRSAKSSDRANSVASRMDFESMNISVIFRYGFEDTIGGVVFFSNDDPINVCRVVCQRL